MASGFIIWNVSQKRFAKGPFPSREDAEGQVARYQASKQDVNPDTYQVVEVEV